MEIDYINITTSNDNSADEKVKVNKLDPKSEYLYDKLISADNSIIISTTNDNKRINLRAFSGATKYIHNQIAESQMWIIHHNLNTLPFVLTINNGQQVFGSVYYPNTNVVYIYFSTPINGIAYCF